MRVTVCFHSWFKELTGCAQTSETIPDGTTLGALVENLMVRFPKLSGMRRSMLMAVDVEYQNGGYVLQNGDEVSLFPPVQGG